MPDVIHLLSESISNQIAAGEVIQRPASVVKELMENSVDAGSTRISAVIKDGGRTSIQIIDNGCGMSKTDARMCFERHATSKIHSAKELQSINSLGFRGEALAAVASIAQVVVRTRKADEEIGTEVSISGTRIESHEPVACPKGSSFMVKNLFFNVPARRKFLKTDKVEFKHVIYEFQRIALANPNIDFVLSHNNTEIYNLPKSSYRQRIVHIFGKAINQNLTPVEASTDLITLNGFIGKPEYARKTTGEQFFFVNKRFIKHHYFHKAVMTAYEKILAPDTLPSYFIYFESKPESIDVNIHPTKTEIKFENEMALFRIVNAAVREALGKFNIMPSIDFNLENAFEIPVHKDNQAAQVPPISYNPDYDPFEEELKQRPVAERSRIPETNLKNWDKLFDKEVFLSEADKGQADDMEVQRISPASIIGDEAFMQLKHKYILTSVKSGLMVIDQKRAHERILFESYIKSLALNSPVAQRTLFPETIELDAANYMVLKEMLEDLQTIGFDLSDFGSNTFVINGCPMIKNNLSAKALIERFLEIYKSTGSDVKVNAREKLASSLARANAIDYGEPLTPATMREIVDNLFACESPNYSPEGKPVVSIITVEELEKKLK